MSARLGQITLVITILAVGYYFFTVAQGAIQIGSTITTSSDLENGLVLHWTFDGDYMDISAPSGEVLDRSGSDLTGDWLSHATTAAAGVIGQAIEFDGVDDVIKVNDNVALNPSSWTISAWYYINATTSDGAQYIVAKNADYNMDFNQPELTHRCWFTDGSNIISEDTAKTVPLKTWTHGVCVYDATADTLTGYQDTVLTESQDTTGFTPPNGTNPFRVGARFNTGDEPVDGLIDDVRFYNRVLSLDEINKLYQLGANNFVSDTVTPSSLETGLVGHWTFDGEYVGTTTVYDRSVEGNHGYASTSNVSYGIGRIGQALLTNDTEAGERVTLFGSPNSLDMTDAISICAWTQIYDLSDTFMTIFDKKSTGQPWEYWLGFSSNRPTFMFNPEGGSDDDDRKYLYSPVTVNDFDWHHICGTYDRVEMRVYLDNVLVNTYSTTSAIWSADSTVQIGNASHSNTALKGMIDDVRIYNRALTTAEVQRLYQIGTNNYIGNTVTPSGLETGLVGHWTFDGENVDWSSTTAEIRDRSNNANHGDARNGMSATSSPQIGVIGQAIQFDGDNDDIVTADPVYASAPMAVSFWYYLKSIDTDATLIVQRSDGTPVWRSWQFYADSGSKLLLYTVNDGTVNTSIVSDSTVTTGRWYHAVGVLDASFNMNMYVDGVLQTDTDTVAAINPLDTTSMRIGSQDASSGFSDAYIDDVRVYNRALSAAEVKRLYQLGR